MRPEFCASTVPYDPNTEELVGARDDDQNSPIWHFFARLLSSAGQGNRSIAATFIGCRFFLLQCQYLTYLRFDEVYIGSAKYVNIAWWRPRR